jgi:hypothetical protein
MIKKERNIQLMYFLFLKPYEFSSQLLTATKITDFQNNASRIMMHECAPRRIPRYYKLYPWIPRSSL